MVLSSTLGMLVFQSKFLDKKSIWVRELKSGTSWNMEVKSEKSPLALCSG